MIGYTACVIHTFVDDARRADWQDWPHLLARKNLDGDR